jgi:hypothetical protein
MKGWEQQSLPREWAFQLARFKPSSITNGALARQLSIISREELVRGRLDILSTIDTHRANAAFLRAYGRSWSGGGAR